MKIRDMFADDINRKINGVIKVDQAADKASSNVWILINGNTSPTPVSISTSPGSCGSYWILSINKVRALIQEPEFLEGKGLSNEVNIRIFCYEPENEMVVRHFVNQMETDQSLDCHLKICNLYKTFLSICDDLLTLSR